MTTFRRKEKSVTGNSMTIGYEFEGDIYHGEYLSGVRGKEGGVRETKKGKATILSDFTAAG